MPTLIEGVVSDYAQPGHKNDRPELTIGDLETFAEKLKRMPLTYDHAHPLQSTDKAPVDEHTTVGRIVDAWVDDEECLRVRAELDDTNGGQRTADEIKSKFLTGFSLGLAHANEKDKNGVPTVFHKDVFELSITPMPEMDKTSFVRILDDVSASSLVHCKLGDLKDVMAKHRDKSKLVAITASSGERDRYTAQRSREILAALKRSARPVAAAAAQPSRTGAGEFSNHSNLNSQRAPSKTRNQQQMSGQFEQQGRDAQLDEHISSLKGTRDARAARAIDGGHEFTQDRPRGGIAPVVINNYLDDTRRRAAPMAYPGRQAPPPQQRRRQQQQQQQGYGEEMIQYEDDVDFGNDDDDNDYYQEPPPQQQQRRGRSQPAPQQRRRGASVPRQQQQSSGGGYVDSDDVPPPAPDVAQESMAADMEKPEPKTQKYSDIEKLEKKQREEFVRAGGKLDKKQALRDKQFNGVPLNDVERDEFEQFKEFKQMKRKQSSTQPQKRSGAQSTNDNMFIDASAPAAAADEDAGEDADAADEDDDVDDKLDPMEKLRRENEQLKAALSGKKAKTTERVNSIKKNMKKEAPAAPQNNDDDDGDAPAYGGQFDDDGNAIEEDFDLNGLNAVLKLDNQGKSQAKEEFFERVDDLKEKRKEITQLKLRLTAAKQDPSKKSLEGKLTKQLQESENTFLRNTKKLSADVLDFISNVNLAHKQQTDPRQFELISSMTKKRGIMTERDLDVIGSQVVAVSASSSSMGKTLAAVTERFNRERLEKEKLQFTANEQARLLGHASDSSAAERMVNANDPVARAAGHKFGKNMGEPGKFFTPSSGRKAFGAKGSYAGYDPLTMAPVGVDPTQYTMQEITGIPFKFRDHNTAVAEHTKLVHSFRQEMPNLDAPLVPRNAGLREFRGVFRTRNVPLIQQISASRAESGMTITQETFNKLTRNPPRGAELSPDGKFYVLPDPTLNGGQ